MELMEGLLHDRQLGLVAGSAGVLSELELYAADFVINSITITEATLDLTNRALTGLGEV